MTSQITDYKKPLYILTWLETALRKEWQKYVATPVTADLMPTHEVAQAWGYVVAGYFLLEQGFKAVLHARAKVPLKTHALSVLFAELPPNDQDLLRAHYDDFRQTFPGMQAFPLVTLDDFLVNLDGAQNDQGHFVGSLDWRYFLTEETGGQPIPRVSINIMHETAYGSVRLLESIHKGSNEARRYTYSWRLHRTRAQHSRDWLTVQMNSPRWNRGHDRLEILWGPDYSDRYDYFVVEGDRVRSCFAPLPNADELEFPIVDKRAELEAFDPEEGFRSIGVTLNRSADPPEAASPHVMY